MGGMIRLENMHPLRELEEIGERFNRLFARVPARGNGGQEALTVADWIPKVDITEDDNEYVIKVEIPEVDKEVDKKDVKVTVQDGVLTIQGERKQEKEEDSKRFHRVERFYGTFVRSFALPEEVAEDKLKAEFKDGMLLVHLPKAEKAKPKSVEIQVQ
jgi:HSP20 family protein